MRCLKVLLKAKLVHHENTKYDGYRLTYLGYDYLAIKTLVNRGIISSVGRQIGVGKEADVFEVSTIGVVSVASSSSGAMLIAEPCNAMLYTQCVPLSS